MMNDKTTKLTTGTSFSRRNCQILALALLSFLLFLQYAVMITVTDGNFDTMETGNHLQLWLEEFMHRRRNAVAPVVVDWDKRVEVKRKWLKYIQSQMPKSVMKKSRKGLSRADFCARAKKELQNSTIIHSLQTPADVGYDEINNISAEHPTFAVGGGGGNQNEDQPKNITKHHHAFIVPYRDRKYHLEQFLLYMSRYLQYHYGGKKDTMDLVDPPQIQRLRSKIGVEATPENSQDLHHHFFSLYLIEQDDNYLFNRALLQNTGLDHVAPNVECVIQHDVDVVPGFYSAIPYHDCQKPTHLAVRAEPKEFRPLYPGHVGLTMTIHQQHWACLNGMDNQMQGWGKEDDELFLRLQFLGMAECSRGEPYRASAATGNVFTSISQQSDHHKRGERSKSAKKSNKKRYDQFLKKGISPTVASSGGWHQTKYNIVSRESWDMSDEILQGFHEIHYIKVQVDKSSLEKCFGKNCDATK